jgi:uncharacterized protein
MSALREQLRGALKQPTRHGPAAPIETVTGLDDLSALGGTWFESERGPGYVIDSYYDGGHLHGEIALHRALGVDTAALAGQMRDPRIGEREPASFLFIDTETTGMGGAGALVFLAGVARFEGTTLRLRQFLLPAPSYEGGLIGGLARELAAAEALVSYNGKSFDVPTLEARAVLSRASLPLRSLPHLDLLHPNRRLFRGVFESHRLPEVEVRLLGFQREDDCPSHEVPARYFAFQRSGDPTHIAPVLRHNAWDILSLVALTARLADECSGAGKALQAARAAEYAGDDRAAAAFYGEALKETRARAVRADILERMARSHRRMGDFEEAAACWKQMLKEPRNRHLQPYVELAKLYEHRLGRKDEALRVTREAADLVARGLLRPGTAGSETSAEALAHRLARLERRSVPKSRTKRPAIRAQE